MTKTHYITTSNGEEYYSSNELDKASLDTFFDLCGRDPNAVVEIKQVRTILTQASYIEMRRHFLPSANGKSVGATKDKVISVSIQYYPNGLARAWMSTERGKNESYCASDPIQAWTGLHKEYENDFDFADMIKAVDERGDSPFYPNPVVRLK